MSGSCTAPLDNVTRIAKQISDMCISNQNFTAHISVAFEKCWWGMLNELIEFWALLVKIYRWVGIKTSNIIKVWCGVFLENSILNFCGRIWGYELYAPCNKRSFGATWPVSWGPLVLFPVGDFLRIPSLKELWEWDKAVNTQNNLHMKNLDYLSSKQWCGFKVVSVTSGQTMEFVSEFAVHPIAAYSMNIIQYIFR